jgi:hypothetical protein
MKLQQFIIFRAYTSTENLKAKQVSVETHAIPNTERAIRKAVKDFGLDDSRHFPHVTTQIVRR